MKTYLLSAVGVIFLSVIISLLTPEGRLKKSVTFIMRLICILVLMQPVTGIFKRPEIPSADSGYLDYDYICAAYSQNQSGELSKLLKREFGCDCVCTVSVEESGGDFKVASVAVEINEENEELIGQIYEYLEKLGYINITVYAKST